MTTFTPESKVIWHRKPSKKQSLSAPVDAIVVALTGPLVTIAIYNPAEKQVHFDHAKPEELTARDEPAPIDDVYIADRVARTMLTTGTRKRRVYDICKLERYDEHGIRYHGFVNHQSQGEKIFTVVGATTLNGSWYDINLPSLLRTFLTCDGCTNPAVELLQCPKCRRWECEDCISFAQPAQKEQWPICNVCEQASQQEVQE